MFHFARALMMQAKRAAYAEPEHLSARSYIEPIPVSSSALHHSHT